MEIQIRGKKASVLYLSAADESVHYRMHTYTVCRGENVKEATK
jgi:hypothetical protein